MDDRPKTANAIKGSQVDMREFCSSVVDDLRVLAQRLIAIETRLNAMDLVNTNIRPPSRHLSLRSLRH